MKKMLMITVLGLTACSLDPKDPNFLVPYEIAKAKEIALEKAKEDLVNQVNIYGGDNPEILCNNFIGYQGVKPDYVNCADDARRLYAIKKQRIENEQEAERKRIATEELAERQRELDESARKEAEEQQKKAEEAALAEDLKSGVKKPENMNDFMLLYDAENGLSLAGNPKIKPDGKFYGVMGSISIANEDDSFIAESIEDLARVLAYMPVGEKKYFKIIIPENLKENYNNTARVNGLFRAVGRYVDNETYTTVIGQQKSMPVFEAVYWMQD
jgi:hypothetical protein